MNEPTEAASWWRSQPANTRWAIWIIGSGVAFVLLIALMAAIDPNAKSTGSSSGAGGASAAGTQSAGACIKAVEAMRQYSEGTRSYESTIDALRSAEGPARDAAERNARYAPIAQAIVQAEDELATGPGPGIRLLVRECR